jgi:hypothetical protein
MTEKIKNQQTKTGKMKKIPVTETALMIRTDFSDAAAWKRIVEAVQEPVDPFIFNMEIVDDREYEGATVEQLMRSISDDYPHSFIVVVDQHAISQPDHPLLIVDLLEERGRQFRALPSEVPSIDNNLSIANMGFEEFADSVDDTGVFRGFPEM